MERNRIKSVARIFLAALALGLMLTVLNATKSVAVASLGKSVCLFAFTYFVLDKYNSSTSAGLWMAVSAICLGSIAVELPVRVIDFSGTIASLIMPVIGCTSIVMAGICYKEKRPAVFALSIFAVLLMSTLGVDAWSDFCHR